VDSPGGGRQRDTGPSRDYQVGGGHYVAMSVQPWDALRAWLEPAEWRGYLRGNVIKYMARAGATGPALEDLRKAQHYLAELIDVTERDA